MKRSMYNKFGKPFLLMAAFLIIFPITGFVLSKVGVPVDGPLTNFVWVMLSAIFILAIMVRETVFNVLYTFDVVGRIERMVSKHKSGNQH